MVRCASLYSQLNIVGGIRGLSHIEEFVAQEITLIMPGDQGGLVMT